MKQPLLFIKKHKYAVIIALLVAVLCIIPLSVVQIGSGHDMKFHLCRIQSVCDNISQGKWFSPIYTTYLDGYGYGSPLFYGDVFLHIPGFLMFLGVPIETSFRIFLMLLTSLTAFTSYYCTKRMFKSDIGAFTASVVYTFSSYFVTDSITRVALGEVQAFVFLPLIAYGFYSIVFENKEKWLFLPLGLAGCVLSHVITAFVSVIILFVLGIVFIKKFISDRSKFLWVLYSIAVFFGVSAFFIFPLIEQYFSYDFAVNNGLANVQWGTLSERSMPIEYIFSLSCMGTTEQWIPNGIGYLPVFSVFAIAACIAVKEKFSRFAPAFVIASILTMVIASDVFPWDGFQDLFGSIQFPWRLMIFATFFLSIGVGVFVSSVENKTIKLLSVCVAAAMSLYCYVATGIVKFNNCIKIKEKGGYIFVNDDEREVKAKAYECKYANTIGAGEYIPTYYDTKNEKWEKSANIKGRILRRGDKVTSNNNISIEYIRNYDILEAEFSGNTNAETYMEFPLLMYKGYAAYIDGDEVEATYGENSIVRVYLGDRESGKITVYYKGTALQTVTKVISVAVILGIIGVILKRKVRKRLQTNSHRREASE